MSERRLHRVNAMLQQELSDLIMREVKDPRLAEVVSITKVDVSQDLREAKVHISVLGTEQEKRETMQGLEAASAFLHRSLRDRIAIKHIPLLSFHLDNAIENGARILQIMREEEQQARRPKI